MKSIRRTSQYTSRRHISNDRRIRHQSRHGIMTRSLITALHESRQRQQRQRQEQLRQLQQEQWQQRQQHIRYIHINSIDVSDLIARLTHALYDNASLHNTICEMKKTCNKLQVRCNVLIDENATLLAVFRDADSQIERLNTELNAAYTILNADTSRHNDKITQLFAEIDKLNDRLIYLDCDGTCKRDINHGVCTCGYDQYNMAKPRNDSNTEDTITKLRSELLRMRTTLLRYEEILAHYEKRHHIKTVVVW